MTNEEARVELVVKIDEGTYKDIKKGKVYTSFRDVPQEVVLAIANGIPLPKGHGDLIDRCKLVKELSVVSYRPVQSQMWIIEQAPAIIEAESEEKE